MEGRDHETPLCLTHEQSSVAREFSPGRRGASDRRHGRHVLVPEPAATVDTWLQWFDTYKQASCRAFLCTRYHLNTLDAEALMNTARLQVFLHWDTIKNPLAYFWQTLKHAVGKQGRRRAHERRRLVAYARQRRADDDFTARTAQHVADILERVPPRQRCLLAWYAQGYEDTQVAVWLGTTPQAVRVARHGAYCALRAKLRLPGHHPGQLGGGKNFFAWPNILSVSRTLYRRTPAWPVGAAGRSRRPHGATAAIEGDMSANR